MRYQRWRTAIMVVVIGALSGLWTREIQASGLFDWMSRCGAPAEPQIVYYPMTTVYQTAATDCCEPTVCCQSPEPVYCPPAAVYQPRPSIWQRMGACWAPPAVPQTQYRTNWKKVPVTSYRPVVSTDPVTGCPVTVMKPCTTYTWQPDRIGCGLFDRLLGRCRQATPQVECCMPTDDCVAGGYVVGVSSSCCEPMATSPAPTPAAPAAAPIPYYAPGAPSVLTMPPAAPAPVPTLVPQGGAPPASSVPAGSQPPTAADVRPALKPVDVIPESPAAAQPPQPAQPVIEDPASPSHGEDLQHMPQLGPPVLDPDTSRLSPVPDPDAIPVAPVEGNTPPPLIHPQDQVASLRTGQSWAITPIVWPVAGRAEKTLTTTPRTPRTPPKRDLRPWDESGWQSVRKAP